MGDCMLDLFLIILQSLAPIQYPLTSKAFRIEIKCNKLNTAYCFEDWNFDTQNNTAYCFEDWNFDTQNNSLLFWRLEFWYTKQHSLFWRLEFGYTKQHSLLFWRLEFGYTKQHSLLFWRLEFGYTKQYSVLFWRLEFWYTKRVFYTEACTTCPLCLQNWTTANAKLGLKGFKATIIALYVLCIKIPIPSSGEMPAVLEQCFQKDSSFKDLPWPFCTRIKRKHTQKFFIFFILLRPYNKHFRHNRHQLYKAGQIKKETDSVSYFSSLKMPNKKAGTKFRTVPKFGKGRKRRKSREERRTWQQNEPVTAETLSPEPRPSTSSAVDPTPVLLLLEK